MKITTTKKPETLSVVLTDEISLNSAISSEPNFADDIWQAAPQATLRRYTKAKKKKVKKVSDDDEFIFDLNTALGDEIDKEMEADKKVSDDDVEVIASMSECVKKFGQLKPAKSFVAPPGGFPGDDAHHLRQLASGEANLHYYAKYPAAACQKKIADEEAYLKKIEEEDAYLEKITEEKELLEKQLKKQRQELKEIDTELELPEGVVRNEDGSVDLSKAKSSHHRYKSYNRVSPAEHIEVELEIESEEIKAKTRKLPRELLPYQTHWVQEICRPSYWAYK